VTASWRIATKQDVADAATIAELIGGADLANAGFTCIEAQPPRKLHDCPDCDHFEYAAQCEHATGEWECVVAAIGASRQAHDLWMETSNAFFATMGDREGDLRYLQTDGTTSELQEHVRLYAWVDSIQRGGINNRPLGYGELEVALLLREGHLPPGWKLVAKRASRTRAPR